MPAPAALARTMNSVAHVLFSPLIGLWLRMSWLSWRALPSPDGIQHTAAPGPNADRVLVVGSGVAVGYGVATADLALGGYLARAVAARTGRGASVQTVARFGLKVDDVPEMLAEFDLTRFDAVLMIIGMDEALHLVPVDAFRSSVNRLLDRLAEGAPRTLGIVMVGIPDVTTIMTLPRAARRPVKHRSAQLDAELRRLCSQHPQLSYLPFVPTVVDLERDGDRHLYAAWADRLAPVLSDVLDANLDDPRDPAVVQEFRRQLALDDLHILDTPPEAQYDRIVTDARRMFGVRGASITFIDRERQWSKAVDGMDPTDSPRGSALGDATVQNGKLFVVEDASADERFATHPWVKGVSRVRFFAGFPIEASNGERIGALCLCDPLPRSFTGEDDAMLGVLARRVQVALWG